MTLILKQLFAFFKLLNSDQGSRSIAAGIALGFVMGMSPALSLQALVMLLILFLFRVQAGAATLAAFFFAFMAFLLDPLFDVVGRTVLSAAALQGLFTTLYNLPVVPMTRFNDSVVMGAGLVGIALSPLVYWVSLKLVAQYREKVVARFKQTKVFKAFTMTSFFKWYVKYDEMFG
jgi:uncharacterized protein (TIGR03546 family)